MSTLERLQTILINSYPLQPEALAPEARLEQLEIDSLGVMELFFSIEDEFKLTVPNEQQNLATIGDVVAYIDRLIAEQHGVDTASGAAP
jgi:acyl carrier protein